MSERVFVALPDCQDCGAKPGEIHSRDCDVQYCTVCGGQRMCCDCEGHDEIAARWTGQWPGEEACRQLGWYARMVPGRGWQTCSSTDPGAREDLNRWAILVARERARAEAS